MSNIWVRGIRIGVFEKDIIVGNAVLKGAGKLPGAVEFVTFVIEEAFDEGRKRMQRDLKVMLGVGVDE